MNELNSRYECIKSFSIDLCNDDGFLIENKSFIIDSGDIFDVSVDKILTGCDIRLDNENKGWIEITLQELNEFFIELKPIVWTNKNN